MKTTTYARLALLIPFLVWCFCVLLLLLANALFPNAFSSSETFTLSSVVGIVVLFYVFGIFFWLVPYLLVCIVLFILSFKSRLEVLKPIFLLSPFAMAILITIETIILAMTSPEGSISYHSPSLSSNSILTIAMFAAITLAWGYLCIGIGWGLYVLFQRYRIIKDEVSTEFVPVTINQPE